MGKVSRRQWIDKHSRLGATQRILTLPGRHKRHYEITTSWIER